MFFIDDVQENHEQTKNCAVSVVSITSQFLHHLRSFAGEKKVAKDELNQNDFPWLLGTRFVQMENGMLIAVDGPYRGEKYGSH